MPRGPKNETEPDRASPRVQDKAVAIESRASAPGPESRPTRGGWAH